MNKTERKQIMRLNRLITSIPFPQAGGGSASASMSGFVAYSVDMRNALPIVDKILIGLAMTGVEGLEKGWDYEDPSALMNDLEVWIEKRKAEDWASVTDYDLRVFREERAEAALREKRQSKEKDR